MLCAAMCFNIMYWQNLKKFLFLEMKKLLWKKVKVLCCRSFGFIASEKKLLHALKRSQSVYGDLLLPSNCNIMLIIPIDIEKSSFKERFYPYKMNFYANLQIRGSYWFQYEKIWKNLNTKHIITMPCTSLSLSIDIVLKNSLSHVWMCEGWKIIYQLIIAERRPIGFFFILKKIPSLIFFS